MDSDPATSSTQQYDCSMKTHYDYAVVIVLVALVVMFFMLVGGCSAFKEDIKFEYDCELECGECKELKLHCANDLGKDTEGEDKGVNIINDLGGIVK